MKAIYTAAVFGLLSLTAAHAEPFAPNAPAQDSAGKCIENSSFSRVDYTLPLGPQCCDGKLRCSQLLSTEILKKPHHPART